MCKRDCNAIKTSSPKGNDRSSESQQVKSSTYFEKFSVKKVIVQGQVTPTPAVLVCPKSNPFNLLCMSLLPATLMKMQSKMETSPSNFKYMGYFSDNQKAANFAVRGRIWSKFDFIEDFMHVLLTCKFEKGSDH